MNEPILLIVDDEKATRDGLRIALEDNFDCYIASDIAQAKAVLKSETVDVMLTDLRMGADSGMDLLEHAQKLSPPPVSIMMTAYGSVDTAVEAMRRGAWHFVTKPLNIDEVELLAKRAIKKQNSGPQSTSPLKDTTTDSSSVSSTKGLERLIGSSTAMHGVHEMIKQVGPSKATILIEGDSGTGKELVAQAVHDVSTRAKNKLVTVNCAALSSQLLESELFGHEKGAFTGATQRRVGRFEEANGGTLFLDEIGEIDASTQVKLLRALSEKTIERVGSNTSVKVDVRIVTATNKNLAQLVAEDKFREDLYFRLNVVKISMPPLKARGDDVALLAEAFLKEFAKENNRPVKPLSERALNTLRAYSWPGNVRELRTTIEHGVVMSNEETIRLNHLPTRIQVNESIHKTASEAQPPLIPQQSNPQTTTLLEDESFDLAEIEKKTILKAIQHTGGNRTEAAILLGISRRTLHRKLNSIQST